MRRSLLLAFALGAFGLLAGASTAFAASPPAGVTGIALSASVEVAWQPAAGASSYAVYRGTSPSAITTRVSPPGGVFGTSWSDSTAVNGTTYYYAVRAVESGIESGNSRTVRATPAARSCSTGNPTVLENCFPGSSNWTARAVETPAAGGIEGFATAQSINKGASVDLKVNTGASATFSVEVYRMGYYGGTGARLLSTIQGVQGVAQPACSNDASTGLVDCSNWSVSATLTTTSSWVSGMYLLRIVRDGTSSDSHILLAVRDDARTPQVVWGSAMSTFQAYNNYGGRSLYDFNSGGANTVGGSPRAVKVSFDRPYNQIRVRQHDWFTETEQPVVAWLERQGFDMSYISGTDLERTPALAAAGRAYISPAHDEYISSAMRSAMKAARDAGDGLLFTGANGLFWRVRFEPSPQSGVQDRVLVSYKTTERGIADPVTPTTTWRDATGANDPENALMGQMYIGQDVNASYALRVSADQGTDRLYRYTGLDQLPAGGFDTLGNDTVGWEWDARVDNGREPAGVKTLASSPVSGDILQDAGRVYARGSAASNMTKYKAASGALVVATGTNQWWRGLGTNIFNEGTRIAEIEQFTTNALVDMGASPATPAAGITLDTPVSVVAPPNGVVATAGSTDSVTLTWNAVSGATYNVYRLRSPRDGGFPLGQRANATTLSSTTTTFVDTGLASGATYYYVVTATVGGRESIASTEVSATTPATSLTARRINVGGPAYTAASGAAWEADTGFSGGSTNSTTLAIAGTNDPAIYQNERWGDFTYAIPVATGTYDVRFHFAELYFGTQASGGAGSRQFSMDILDTASNPDVPNIDIFGAVGARTALVRTVQNVRVTDGTLNVRTIRGAADDPQLTGLEIVPSAPLGPPTVSGRTPADGVTGVAAGVRPTVTFSRDMDSSTLTGGAVTLERTADGATVPATVTYDAPTATATIRPTNALAWSTGYRARVSTAAKAADGVAMASAVTWTFTTSDPPPPDTQAPTVTMTAPTNGATLKGTVRLKATASDNVGVAGVQFKRGGVNIGNEDTDAPYELDWNTFSAVANGSYALTAVARDEAGNVTPSAAVNVTVANPPVDPTGLVGAWGFEEPSGTTATDASGTANNGTVSGATRSTAGRFGSALSFDGVNDIVNVPDANSLDLANAMTLEAWVRPTATNDWRTAIFKEQPVGLAYSLYANGNTSRPSVHVTTAAETDTRGTAALAANTWTHIAGTYDGATLRIYVNGTQVSSKTVTGAIMASGNPLRIGGNTIWGEYFGGLIDEVRVYSRTLTASEISLDMNTAVVPAVVDTQAPTAPGTLTATGSLGQAALGWGAATDNTGVDHYDVHRSQTSGFTPSAANRIAQPAGTSYTDTAVTAGDWYYRVRAVDAAGNIGPATAEAHATVTADTTAPTVSVSAPTAGSTVVGTVTVTASAADNVAVASVQFKLDGNDLGAADTSAPFSAAWDTLAGTNGAHTLTAVARDGAGNSTTSAAVAVSVDNPPVDTSGLVGAWGFEEGGGTTAADSSTSENDGTLNGAVWTTNGRFGKALSFDGTNDRVAIPDASSLDLSTAMTLEAWVRPNSGTGWRTTLMKQTTNGLVYGMYASGFSDHPSGHANPGTENWAVGPNALPTGTWSHLATTWDGTTIRLYLNGTQIASQALSGTLPASTGVLNIGGNTVWGEYFDGLIDEVRVYRRALSASEISQDMGRAVGDAPPPASAAQVGTFSPPVDWPLVPVHIATLNNGKIAVWDGFDAALNSERIWDPATGTFDPIPSGRNLFCSGHITLPDGRLFVAGGHVAANEGLKDTHIFNPANKTWFRGTDMGRARWYPTATTLPDGRILVVSGDNITLNQPGYPTPLKSASETLPEIYDVANNTWTQLPAGQRRMPLYPFMFVLPDGRVVDAGPDLQTRTLNTSTGQWTNVTTSQVDGHSAVMYRPGKILKSGTWADPDFVGIPASSRAQTIDFNQSSPTWQDTGSMNHGRSYHTLTVLPDGNVLATGGMSESDGIDRSKAVLSAEMWDPDTGVWSEMASGQRPREYHSSALLLQDGRVLLAGGGAFPPNAQDEKSAEIYSPPYLFKGSRPTITSAPAQLNLGQTFTVNTPDAANIDKVALIRMGSVTHNFDMDQRFQNLSFTKGSGTLQVTAPSSANNAPPGWFYVFAINDKGVPSTGWIVKINPATADTQAPTAPPNLTAAVQNATDVKLTWDAATDNVGVTEYRIYRSATTGFTPSAANRIATVSGSTLTYTDMGRPAGTWYYLAVAADAAGNAGTSSREEAATIVPDTTAPTVSVSAPAAGATVSGANVTLSATASDNRGVASVQFKVDGANVGSADTSAPYSITWDSRTVSDGAHTITAVATDTANLTTTSAGVSVTADNAPVPDTQAPTAPTNLAGTTPTPGNVQLGWSAATDNVAVVRYNVHRSTTQGFTPSAANRIGQPTATSFSDSGRGTGDYYYRVTAEDAAGNIGPASSELKVSVDATAPTVSITAPAGGTTVSGTTTVSASAADAVGVASVQFRLDGADLGAADTSSPYSISWNTLAASNGSHNLTAVARDAAGNATTSSAVAVTVSNTNTGLIAALGFDETSGTTATDSSGTGNNGTISGATRSTAGRFGGALSFDGVNDWVTVADANTLDLTNALTLEAWVRPSAITGWRTVLLKERTGGLVYALYSNEDSSRPSVHSFIGATEFDSRGTAQVAANAWTHLAASYDGANLRMFVNGTQVSSRALTGSMSASTGALRIGGNNIWSEWFGGLIDEVRVYNRALSATEISTDMNRAVTGG